MARRFSILLIASLFLAACGLSQAERNKATYHFEMGESLYAENNVTSALREFTEAAKITPDDPQLMNFLGLTYYRKGCFDLAEKAYRHALEIKPGFSEARNNLGVDYLDMKRWDDAIREFTKVEDDLFYQGHENAMMNLGLAYLGKGDYRKALDLLRDVSGRNPRNPRAKLNLGRVYFAMGRTELAITEYRKALEIAPSYASAHYHLALAQMKLKNSEAARQSFKDVVRIVPDSELGQLSREYLDLLRK